MAHVSTTPIVSSSFTARLSAAWAEFKDARELSAKYRATVRELSELSDSDLRDIGISRYDIAQLAHQHVYGN